MSLASFPGMDASNDGRVLLVEDDRAVRRAYDKYLKSMGWTVTAVEDGRAAVAQLPGSSFDVIVSDIAMPNMTGIEFIRSIRQENTEVPVILMTGNPAVDTAVEAVEYGAFRYLTKPVELAELDEVMRRAQRLHQMTRLRREVADVVSSERATQRTSRELQFYRALEQTWMAYQPIVCCSGRSVFAYEALVRSHEVAFRSPAQLLEAAEQLGKLPLLGQRIRAGVAAAADQVPDGAALFVNLHPFDLDDEDLYSAAAPLSKIASRVVLEVTERASLEGIVGLPQKIRTLRRLGYRIAVDDLGAGYAGLSSFTELEPEFVKLDMSLVRGIDLSAKKRSVVGAMIRLCTQELGIQVISEGIETSGERDAVRAEGGDLLQGYLFAKPTAEFAIPQW